MTIGSRWWGGHWRVMDFFFFSANILTIKAPARKAQGTGAFMNYAAYYKAKNYETTVSPSA